MADVICTRPTLPNSRWIGLFELSGITAGFFYIVWRIGPNLDSNGLAVPLTLVLGAFLLYFAHLSPHHIHRDTPVERGLGSWQTAFLRIDNLSQAARSFGLLCAVATAIILTMTLILRSSPIADINPHALVLKFGLYLFNALGQDLLFLSFFSLRLRRLLEPTPLGDVTKRLAVSLLCALLFALYHLPNTPLMTATLLMGFASAWIWYTTPNLLVAASCHAVVGTLLHQVLELHMRIGPFYWENDKYVFRTLFPVLRRVIGDLY